MEKEHINFEQDTDARKPKLDTGLSCLVMIAKYHGVAAEPEQIKHAFAVGNNGMNETDIVRAARELGFKAKAANVEYERLQKLPVPFIAEVTTGNGREAIGDREFVILAKVEGEQLLILHPAENKPRIFKKDDFVKQWRGNGQEAIGDRGKVILLSHRGLSFLKSEEFFGLKWFIPAIWKYRKPLGEVLIASLVLQIFGLVMPIFTQVIIDKVLVHRGLTTLDVLAIGLLAIALFEAVLSITRTYVFTHTTSKIDVTLGTKLFKHLLALPLRYFEVRRVGDTVARVRELENIRHFLTGAPLTSVLDVMFMVVFIAVMFFYSTALTLVALAALPFFAGLSALITPMLRHRLDERFNRGADAQSYLVEAVTGMQTVKSFALEPELQKKWEGLLSGYIRSSFKTYQLSGIAGALGQFINRASYLVILWVGAHLVIDGSLSVGQLIAFQMLSARVIEPVLRLVQMWQEFQQTGLSIKRLGDIFNTKPEPAMNPTKARLPAIKGNVKLEGVRFRYRVDGSEILRNMSFDIAPGMTIGIMGRSGSGKSTVAKLIQRLYIPEAGRILIDGIDISLADPAWLRRQIGVVLQENFLFNGSVRDNVAIHYPSASMSEIIRVAQLAGAHEFILELPEGYDTMVGEKGAALSGGQRQRVAIARALLTNPRLLIFDEATSALDYESESIIQKNMKKMCHGRTVIIIAHRLSTLRNADKILVIDKGELMESGSHEELMKQEGLYHYMYNKQAIGDR
ncbi:MAG: type I secretion system permease/ATPase [Nitrospirae bacterium]|nr:type I secretion system permease/ATPase [Nitrospirota bacterium]MCL5977929.1 type I secretion system permease/ATPase [Nitrospirota bacterium]